MRNNNEDIDTEHFLEADTQYPEKLHETHNHLQLLLEKMKIARAEKLVGKFQDKKVCIVYITLKHD